MSSTGCLAKNVMARLFTSGLEEMNFDMTTVAGIGKHDCCQTILSDAKTPMKLDNIWPHEYQVLTAALGEDWIMMDLLDFRTELNRVLDSENFQLEGEPDFSSWHTEERFRLAKFCAEKAKLDENSAACLLLRYHDAKHKHLSGNQPGAVARSETLLALPPSTEVKNKNTDTGRKCEYCLATWRNVHPEAKQRSNHKLVAKGRERCFYLKWLKNQTPNADLVEQCEKFPGQTEGDYGYKLSDSAQKPAFDPKVGPGKPSKPWICPDCWVSEIGKCLPTTSENATDMEQVD